MSLVRASLFSALIFLSCFAATSISAQGMGTPPPPCGNLTSSELCLLPRCSWDGKNSVCMDTPCQMLPPEACQMPRCSFNFSGSLKCSNTPCAAYREWAQCDMASSRCDWHADLERCLPIPCANLPLDNCDPTRCAPMFDTVTGTITACNPRSCEMWTSRERCPVENGECAWLETGGVSGGCFNTTCRSMNTTQCEILQNESNQCVVTNNGTGCHNPMNLEHANCLLATDAATCDAMGSMRCMSQWFNGKFVCTPTRLNSTIDCPNFNAQTCDLQRCGLVSGFCINPNCFFFPTDVECMANKCMWMGGASKCIDPQALQFPCDKLPSGICPPGRCSLINKKCVNFTDSASPNAISGPSSSNNTVPSCETLSSKDNCLTTPLCMWNGTACKSFPCNAFDNNSCPMNRCRLRNDRCIPACPDTTPFLCPSTRRCAANAQSCIVCSASEVQCWDSTCVDRVESCPCPFFRPTKCGATSNIAGSCVTFPDNCTNAPTCPVSTNKICWDGSCILNSEMCPCPPQSPYMCGDGSCRVDSASCTEQCPPDAPKRCKADGACAPAEGFGCSCPFGQFRCPANRQCVSRLAQCPCPASFTRCADGSCSADCVTNVCGVSQVRCPDGTCAGNPALCFCPGVFMDNADISVKITSVVSTKLYVNRWHHIGARVFANACGALRYVNASITWSIVDANTRQVVFTQMGTVMNLAPFTLTPDLDYIITAVASMPLRFNMTAPPSAASASLRVRVASLAPQVRIIGAYVREVPVNRSFDFQIDMTKLGRLRPRDMPQFSWSCCYETQDSQCAGCPMDFITPLSNFSDRIAFVNGISRPGNFTIRAAFRGVISEPQRIMIVDRNKKAPRITIIGIPEMNRLLSNDKISLYAQIDQDQIALTWWVNGVSVPTNADDDNTVTFAPDDYFLRSSWNVIRVVGTPTDPAFAALRIVAEAKIWVPGKLLAGCVLTRPVGELVTLAGQSRVFVKAGVLGANLAGIDVADLRYRFMAKIDRSNATIPLTPFDNDVPSVDFRAPVLRGNPLTGDLVVIMQARLDDDDTIVAAAQCSIQLVQANFDWLNRTLAGAKDNIMAAIANKDQEELNRLSALLSVVSDMEPNATKRGQIKEWSATALRYVVGGNSADALSRTQRKSAIQNAFGLATQGDAPTGAGADEVIKALRDACNISGDSQSSDSIDASNDGPAVLSTLKALGRRTQEVADIAINVGRAAAAQLQRGESTVVEEVGYRLVGLARAADDLANISVDFDSRGSKLRLPESFSLGNDGEQGAISATVFSEDHSNTTQGLMKYERRASDIVDFSFQVDGEQTEIKNLTEPAQIEFRLDAAWAVNITSPKTMIRCLFLDSVSGSWSSEGVTTMNVTLEAGIPVIKCNTTHFSTYTVMAGQEATTTTESPTTTSTTASANNNNASTSTSTTSANGASTTSTTAGTTVSGATPPPTTTSGASGASSTTTSAAAGSTTTTNAGSASTTSAAASGSTTASPTGTNSADGTTTAAPIDTTTTPAPPVGIPRVQFSISALANATGNVTATAFAEKLAAVLGIPTSSLSATITANGVVVVEFTAGGSTAADQAVAATNAAAAVGAYAAASLAPATTTAAPTDDSAPNLGLIIGCAVGGAVLLIIILVIIKQNSSKGTGQGGHNGNSNGNEEAPRELLVVPETQGGRKYQQL